MRERRERQKSLLRPKKRWIRPFSTTVAVFFPFAEKRYSGRSFTGLLPFRDQRGAHVFLCLKRALGAFETVVPLCERNLPFQADLFTVGSTENEPAHLDREKREICCSRRSRKKARNAQHTTPVFCVVVDYRCVTRRRRFFLSDCERETSLLLRVFPHRLSNPHWDVYERERDDDDIINSKSTTKFHRKASLFFSFFKDSLLFSFRFAQPVSTSPFTRSL